MMDGDIENNDIVKKLSGSGTLLESHLFSGVSEKTESVYIDK